MNQQWKMVELAEPQREGYAWGGLVIVYAYDMESGASVPGQFEIWHEASGELMLEVNAGLERVQEIAADLANIADWCALSTTDETMLQARLAAFGAGYPAEVTVYNDWMAAAEWELLVPYGPQ